MTRSTRTTESARGTGLDPWLFQMLRVYLSGASILLIFGGAAAVVLALPGSHRQTMSYAGLAGGVILAALGEASLLLARRGLKLGMDMRRLKATLAVYLPGVVLAVVGAVLMAWSPWWGVALVLVGIVVMGVGTSAVRTILGAGSRPAHPAQVRPRRWRPATFRPTQRQVAEARRAVGDTEAEPPEGQIK